MARRISENLGLVEWRVAVTPPAGRIASELLARRETSPLRESTPFALEPEASRFCASRGLDAPGFLDVDPAEGASYEGCHVAVARAAAAGLGTPAFGVAIWQTSWGPERLFLTAEAHAVLRTPAGLLVDITPKRDGERVIAFALDPRLGPDFDFLKRPNNVHYRICTPADEEARVRGALACMNGPELKLGERRAARAGMTLERWVASRLPPDPVVAAVDSFLHRTERLEALLVPTRAGLICKDEYAFAAASELTIRAHRRMVEAARRRWG